MAIPHSVRRGVVAVLLLIAFVLQGTISVLAGTTGSITGTVVDPSTNQPVAGARVTAQSPTQSATTTSDTTGRFSFISLVPDTYTVSVPATTTRDATSVSGITVQADQTQTVSIAQPTKLKVIGTVTSRAASSLVKPGTTADVYSINAVTQDKASGLGGGGTLNSAWSAISSVPGVFVAPNQAGYIGAGSTLSIRGGDYDQIGYELDGIPLNRAFDQYPSGPLSSLGQQEVQVYTGAPAANAEATGISGYVNQVIRTGTAPASRTLTLATGAPSFYGKVAFEAGGANPTRTFSYYLGAGAYNQNFRYYDQYNGNSLSRDWGTPIASCPTSGITPATVPSCFDPSGRSYTNGGATPAYALGPFNFGLQSAVQDRDTVLNLHFGLPQKSGSKDDIQVLLDINHIGNPYYSSTNDQGGDAYLNAIGYGTPFYTDAFIFTQAPTGALLPIGYNRGGTQIYPFPGSPSGREFQSALPADQRDAFVNDQGIFKLQYQKNFGTNAFLRVYGYTYYSDWLMTSPQFTLANNIGPVSPDYELSSHTRGVSAQFSDQLNAQHLLSIQGSYTTATTTRDNNTGFISGLFGPDSVNPRTVVGALVDSTNPLNGVCYSSPAQGAPHPVNCFNGGGTALNGYRGTTNPTGAQYFTLGEAAGGGIFVPATGICGGGPCQYLVVGNGLYATYNTVVPKFYAASITDHFTPTSRLNIDVGLRFDRFQYNGSNTTGTPARTFWYNAWNRQFTANQQFNVPSQIEGYSVWQPRLGATYTLDPRTVLRASYGRYAQAPNSAFEQYDTLQPDSPIILANFKNFGFNTPGHNVPPAVSNNYDFSFEHQFKGDMSVKLTPFLRKTQDQAQQFYLDQRTNFVSGLNVGRQTSQGFEFELDKGDFSRNGIASRLSFTYTNSYINYTRFKSGTSIIDAFNTDIAAYNAFTAGGGGARCYLAGAVDNACSAGSVANPYYNAPTQPLFDVNAKYAPYDIFPAGIGAGGYTQYGAPFVATWIVQYKKGPLAITPAVQFFGGARYGIPESMPGVDPSSCTTGLASGFSGDPRYPYGAPGGSPYDSRSCGGTLAIPNVFTGKFDNLGSFVEPNQILLHTQVTYDVNKRLTLVGNFANIVNRCFGGSKVPWGVNHACSYTAPVIVGGGNQPIGNVYNPGFVLQPQAFLPYQPAANSGGSFPLLPFNMYFEARIKI
ncbi:MAG: cirA 1 [Candidatus Eremiobacteraeota bacterium]|nr:cirA 1 [Candidatus Eremiobacteraeota bacterium]